MLFGSIPFPVLISLAVLLYSNESEIPIPEKKISLRNKPNRTISKSKAYVLPNIFCFIAYPIYSGGL